MAIHVASPLPACPVGASAASGIAWSGTSSTGVAPASFDPRAVALAVHRADPEIVGRAVGQAADRRLGVGHGRLPATRERLIVRAPLDGVARDGHPAVVGLEPGQGDLRVAGDRPQRERRAAAGDRAGRRRGADRGPRPDAVRGPRPHARLDRLSVGEAGENRPGGVDRDDRRPGAGAARPPLEVELGHLRAAVQRAVPEPVKFSGARRRSPSARPERTDPRSPRPKPPRPPGRPWSGSPRCRRTGRCRPAPVTPRRRPA